MSASKESGILAMLQPDLLTETELIQKIQSRCCRIENLGLMSKEGLVGLFRRVLLPLPQRFYRTNRRGKMLTSRRAKAGLESKRMEEGFSGVQSGSRVSTDRLKPPPDISKPHKVRISSEGKCEKSRSESGDLDNLGIKDRRKLNEDEGGRDSKMFRPDVPSGRKITLKRPSGDEKTSSRSESQTETKRQRTAIKWP